MYFAAQNTWNIIVLQVVAGSGPKYCGIGQSSRPAAGPGRIGQKLSGSRQDWDEKIVLRSSLIQTTSALAKDMF